MKKRIIIEVICGIIILVAGFFIGDASAIKRVNAQINEDVVENNEQKKLTNGSEGKNTDIKESDKKEIKLNQPFEVSTESGDYTFTITGITKTDWWNRYYKNDDKQIILLNYECNNISFKNSDQDGVLLRESAFSAIDDKKYLLDSPSFGYEASIPKVVPVGLKGKFNIAFIAENDIKNVTIKFNRGGEITLPVE